MGGSPLAATLLLLLCLHSRRLRKVARGSEQPQEPVRLKDAHRGDRGGGAAPLSPRAETLLCLMFFFPACERLFLRLIHAALKTTCKRFPVAGSALGVAAKQL